MTRKRRHFERHCRFACAAVAAMVLLASLAGAAAADEDSGQLVTAIVYKPGQAPVQDSVSEGTLVANCPLAGVQDMGQNPQAGPSSGSTSAHTWTLASVLGCLPSRIRPSEVTSVTILREDGTPELSANSQLTAGDLSGSGFPASQVPVIWSDGPNLWYERPARGSNDLNARDRVTDPNPQPFQMEVFETPQLTVTASASSTAVATGATVTFAASARGATGSLSYTWDFDGAGPSNSTAASPQVQFNTAGTYDVVVQVIDSAGESGSGQVQITVGGQPSPASGSANQNGNGTAPGATSSTGPQDGNGTVPGGKRGDKPTPGSASARHHRPSGGATGTHAHKAGGQRNTPAAGSAGSSGGSGNATGSNSPSAGLATRGQGAKAGTSHAIAPFRGSSLSGSLVTGRLIGNVTVLPAGVSPLVHAVPVGASTAPPVRRAIRASLLPALTAGLAVLLLFALGAVRETRWRGGLRPSRLGA